MNTYNKNISELEKKASLWWPAHLKELEAEISVLPLLLESQDKFLSLLNLSDKEPLSIFNLLESSGFPPNLFLKHLAVLADFGGEQIQRLNQQFGSMFTPNSKGYFIEYLYNGSAHKYAFKELPINSILNNNKLNIDGDKIRTKKAITPLMEDMIVLLLHGAASTDKLISVNLDKCEIGSLLGNKEKLEKYVKQKYLWVSRITGGAQANTLGQIAQTYVVDFLKEELGESYEVVSNGKIKLPNLTKPMPFDIVISKGKRSIGVEVSFQVTTNSTIERKSGQSENRKKLLDKSGHHIAYIIDGAGNFQRRSAIETICSNSDCTVAYSDESFKELAQFARDVL